MLFDVGPYGDVWLANAERLAVDLSSIDVLFLSHWHWDHSGGITTVVAAIAAARDRCRSPAARRRRPPRPARPARDPHAIRRLRDAPARAHARSDRDSRRHVVTHADVHVVADLFLASGDIPRQTSYETGLPATTPGAATRSPSIRRSTTSASSPPTSAAAERRCSPPAHTPASSTSDSKHDGSSPTSPSTSCSAATTSPARPSRTASNPTVHDLTNLVAPRIVAPGHCTGWRAAAALANAFGPTGYAPSVVGTRYLLNAS